MSRHIFDIVTYGYCLMLLFLVVTSIVACRHININYNDIILNYYRRNPIVVWVIILIIIYVPISYWSNPL